MSKSKKTNLLLYIGFFFGIIIICIILFLLFKSKPKFTPKSKPLKIQNNWNFTENESSKINIFPNITDLQISENFSNEFNPIKKWKKVLKIVYDENLFNIYIKNLKQWIDRNSSCSFIQCEYITLLVLKLLNNNDSGKLSVQTKQTKDIYPKLMNIFDKICDFKSICNKKYTFYNFDVNKTLTKKFNENLILAFFERDENSTLLADISKTKSKNMKSVVTNCEKNWYYGKDKIFETDNNLISDMDKELFEKLGYDTKTSKWYEFENILITLDWKVNCEKKLVDNEFQYKFQNKIIEAMTDKSYLISYLSIGKPLTFSFKSKDSDKSIIQIKIKFKYDILLDDYEKKKKMEKKKNKLNSFLKLSSKNKNCSGEIINSKISGGQITSKESSNSNNRNLILLFYRNYQNYWFNYIIYKCRRRKICIHNLTECIDGCLSLVEKLLLGYRLSEVIINGSSDESFIKNLIINSSTLTQKNKTILQNTVSKITEQEKKELKKHEQNYNNKVTPFIKSIIKKANMEIKEENINILDYQLRNYDNSNVHRDQQEFNKYINSNNYISKILPFVEIAKYKDELIKKNTVKKILLFLLFRNQNDFKKNCIRKAIKVSDSIDGNYCLPETYSCGGKSGYLFNEILDDGVTIDNYTSKSQIDSSSIKCEKRVLDQIKNCFQTDNIESINKFFKNFLTEINGETILKTYYKNLTDDFIDLKKDVLIQTNDKYIEPLQILYNINATTIFSQLERKSL